jgi:HupE / UreJ protein
VTWIWALLLVFLSVPTFADDVGITSARLLETADGGYALEAEVPSALVAALRQPVVPERFTVTDRPSYRRLGVGLVVRYEFGGSDEPLAPGDTLLLPWARSAVLLTARWSDGTVHRGMFPRTSAGIRVPIEVLRPRNRPAIEIARHHLTAELDSAAPMLLRLLIVISAVLALPKRKGIGPVAIFAAGHALAMVALDLGAPPLSSVLGDAALALGAVLAARAVLRDDGTRIGWLVLAIGLVDGIGIAGRLAATGLGPDDIVPALFGAALGIDLVLVILATVIIRPAAAAVPPALGRIAAVAAGSVSIAVLATIVSTFDSSEKLGADPADRMAAARYALRSDTQGNASGRPAAAPPRRLDDPAMIFLTIEPLEVRLEVLLSLRDFLGPLRIEGGPGSVVPVKVQDAIADRARRMVGESIDLTIDGREAVALLERTDFVAVAATGVTTRTAPEPEPLATSVLGVTLVYGVDRPPSEIGLEWRVFPTSSTTIPATWSDPTGSERRYLTPADPILEWVNEFVGFQPPPVQAVEISPPRLPLISLALLGIAVSVTAFARRRVRRRAAIWVAVSTAVILYPFVRTPLTLPGLAGWAPSKADAAEIADDLLTNVYRAFDFRDEETIYDRLAVTVSGDKLSEIYLENRRALELENRGGARARVDEVEVLEVRSVERDGDGGLKIETVWTVSGSVNHFGHVHYRQNRYDAALVIEAVDGAWKIRDVEILDERRVL